MSAEDPFSGHRRVFLQTQSRPSLTRNVLPTSKAAQPRETDFGTVDAGRTLWDRPGATFETGQKQVFPISGIFGLWKRKASAGFACLTIVTTSLFLMSTCTIAPYYAWNQKRFSLPRTISVSSGQGFL